MSALRTVRLLACILASVVAVSASVQSRAYPLIRDDGTVEFSITAPNAQTVGVLTDLQFLPLSPLGDGRWAGVLSMPPEIYRYVYLVDGQTVPDSANLDIVPGYGPTFPMNYFEVPGDGSQAYEFRTDVEYGRVERIRYYSPVLQRMRQMHVYTPAGYDYKKGRGYFRTYPVLYLLGGAGESDSQWSTVGRAGVILQNLIEDGLAKPMIIVMPNNHIQEPGQVTPEGVDIGDELLDVVVPYVDQHYRTRGGRKGRALAGLSAGGFTTLVHGFSNLDTFSHLGVFSSGLFGGTEGFEATNRDILQDPATNKRLRVFWFGMGTGDFLYDTGRETREMFDRYGIEYQYYENGLGHDWFSWREFLTEFSPLLFRGR